MGNLYIVSTPIGNVQDITIRAIKTLFEVDFIFSEQKNKTALLLSRLSDEYSELIYQIQTQYSSNPSKNLRVNSVRSQTSEKFSPSVRTIKKPKIVSFNEFEEEMKIYEVIQYLERGSNVALVSEAGTPLISDPGFKLVRKAHDKHIPVIPIPGASAVTASLSISGLPTDRFLFIGFPPKQAGKKQNYFSKLSNVLDSKDFNPTIIFFESPHRIEETLQTLKEVFGDIQLVITRELTKIHEEVIQGTISELEIHESIANPRGEFVVLFHL